MELTTLRRLSEKFWNGECSELEEIQLKEAASRGELKGEFQELEDYFTVMSDERSRLVLDDTFDEIMLQRIKPKARRFSMHLIFSIAASVTLLLGFFMGNYMATPTSSTQHNVEFADTYEEPERAYAEVKKALMLLSSNMNEGMAHTEKLQVFHKAQDKITQKK